MSTSVNEMVEHHQAFAALFAEAARRFPTATRQFIGDTLVLLDDSAKPDRLMLVGEALVPHKRVDVDGRWVPVVASMWHGKRPQWALDWLREKHPGVYAEMVEWASR